MGVLYTLFHSAEWVSYTRYTFRGEAIAVLKSNEPCFYAVPPKLYESMLEAMEDLALLMQANARMNDGKELIEVNLDDL